MPGGTRGAPLALQGPKGGGPLGTGTRGQGATGDARRAAPGVRGQREGQVPGSGDPRGRDTGTRRGEVPGHSDTGGQRPARPVPPHPPRGAPGPLRSRGRPRHVPRPRAQQEPKVLRCAPPGRARRARRLLFSDWLRPGRSARILRPLEMRLDDPAFLPGYKRARSPEWQREVKSA